MNRIITPLLCGLLYCSVTTGQDFAALSVADQKTCAERRDHVAPLNRDEVFRRCVVFFKHRNEVLSQ